jgi:hypothetical protein
MNSTKIDFVLTVPAIWSDAAKKSVILSLNHLSTFPLITPLLIVSVVD